MTPDDELPWTDRRDDAIDVILDSWQEWDAEAGDRAQCEQNDQAWRDAMIGFLRVALAGLKPKGEE